MKTLRFYGSFTCLALVGVWTFLALGNGAVQAGGVGATVGTGAAVSVGGHAGGGVGGSGAHIAAAAPMRVGNFSSAGMSNGLRGGGNLRPMLAMYSGPPRYLPGGFAPNGVSHAPSMRVGGLRGPSAPVATQATGFTPGKLVPTRPASAQNAWSDPASGYAAANRGNTFSGTVLFPDAPLDNPASRFGTGYINGGGLPYGSTRYSLRNRGYYRFYGTPYPYLFSGGYAPYFGDGNLGLATSAGDGAIGDADYTAGASNQISTAATNDLSRPYPDQDYMTAPASGAANGTSAPAASSSQNPKGNTEPDSLVEAVQAELSRRGYFGGKVDAVYNDATHAAIQRFQADQQLPATGRINEATLHALQLD